MTLIKVFICRLNTPITDQKDSTSMAQKQKTVLRQKKTSKNKKKNNYDKYTSKIRVKE
jgi:hypothetical protein